jgi:hypothetical protein
LLIGASASCNYADKETRKRIQDWPQQVLSDLEDSGLPLPRKYMNFNPREPGDGKLYLGDQGIVRMKAIKDRLDPHNLFAVATPEL